MLLDVLAGFETLKVCVGYRHGGSVLTSLPAHASKLEEVEPVLEVLPGFADEIDGCRSWGELPAAAKDYVSFVENFVGIPVSVVSVGPDRRQTILR